ncbi:MAG: nitroreductase family protein [Pseudomonadota bacterium]
MELMDIIKKRRSIRNYDSSKKVDTASIEKLIEAAVYAPSGGNVQPYKFLVISNEEKKKEFVETALRQDFIKDASCAIVVCIDKEAAIQSYGKRGLRLYSIQDTAASIQNMLLTAQSLGLSTCWVGAFDEIKVANCLDLSSNLRPIAVIPVGYSDQEPGQRKLKNINEILEWID